MLIISIFFHIFLVLGADDHDDKDRFLHKYTPPLAFFFSPTGLQIATSFCAQTRWPHLHHSRICPSICWYPSFWPDYQRCQSIKRQAERERLCGEPGVWRRATRLTAGSNPWSDRNLTKGMISLAVSTEYVIKSFPVDKSETHYNEPITFFNIANRTFSCLADHWALLHSFGRLMVLLSSPVAGAGLAWKEWSMLTSCTTSPERTTRWGSEPRRTFGVFSKFL